MSCTQQHRTSAKCFNFPSSKRVQVKENRIVVFVVLPGQVLCRPISPSCRAPKDLMPESRGLPNQWKSWQICWWRQWFLKGRGRAVPAEGACEQRTARSAWFSWRRSRAYTPPADLETRHGILQASWLSPSGKEPFNTLSFHNTVINIQHITTVLTGTCMLRNQAPHHIFRWVTKAAAFEGYKVHSCTLEVRGIPKTRAESYTG